MLRRLNEEVYRNYPDVQTIAEESTAWPLVSRPISQGGLGFGMKWDMGWMHDTLRYLSHDPIHRQFHHNELLFRMMYAFSENYALPLSHDEVVHGKGSLIAKMPGDDWQRFANLRLLFGYLFGQPGKKLLFMGGEWGQGKEWNHDEGLAWHQLEQPLSAGVQRWVADLNRIYRAEPALHECDCDRQGFDWIDCNDAGSSAISFVRKAANSNEMILILCHFTPVARRDYPVGVPFAGFWEEVLNSDATQYGGSGVGSCGGVLATSTPWHGVPFSLLLTLPPLAVVYLKCRLPSECARVALAPFGRINPRTVRREMVLSIHVPELTDSDRCIGNMNKDDHHAISSALLWDAVYVAPYHLDGRGGRDPEGLSQTVAQLCGRASISLCLADCRRALSRFGCGQLDCAIANALPATRMFPICSLAPL